jgi:DNA ligase-1
MPLLANLVATSQRVASTSGRRSKVQELSSFLKTLPADEIEIAVNYLSGEIPQGKIGIAYKPLRTAAASEAAADAVLSLSEVDRTLGAIAEMRGTGSTALRAQALKALFSRATTAEQQFLLRLLAGELRQGALAGIMIEAIAAAADLPALRVRQAAMYSNGLGPVARAALLQGAQALSAFRLELFKPASPMLAQTAADPAEALHELGGEAAFEWKMDGARI